MSEEAPKVAPKASLTPEELTEIIKSLEDALSWLQSELKKKPERAYATIARHRREVVTNAMEKMRALRPLPSGQTAMKG